MSDRFHTAVQRVEAELVKPMLADGSFGAVRCGEVAEWICLYMGELPPSNDRLVIAEQSPSGRPSEELHLDTACLDLALHPDEDDSTLHVAGLWGKYRTDRRIISPELTDRIQHADDLFIAGYYSGSQQRYDVERPSKPPAIVREVMIGKLADPFKFFELFREHFDSENTFTSAVDAASQYIALTSGQDSRQ